ncbi:MAG: SAM-dependent methyltransferase [Rhodocyclales bacterium]|nr:SAM-dependent methyltransferase [Rhodocyclales bacterium]
MKCRHCHSPLEQVFADLGSAPPTNAYLTPDAMQRPELWFPLRVLVCTECWLVQAEDYAGRDALFTKDYAYFSSFSSSWLEHSQRYVQAMQARFGLSTESQVAEVAANDGYLLQYFQQSGVPCYGVEPTASTARVAREKGLDIFEIFFGERFAKELVGKGLAADLIAANNVLGHVPDINDFVSGFRELLKPQGVATFEFPHLLNLVNEVQFDTIYHEHFSYLSLTAIINIFTANGLAVFDVETMPTHGGSLRVYTQRSDTGQHPVCVGVASVLEREASAKVASPQFYSDFLTRILEVKRGLISFLLEAQRRGESVVAYGAAAKGNTMLNFAGVRPDLVSYVVDLNPAKQGRFMPGSRIPIVDEARLRQDRPQWILLLPWNLRKELEVQLAYTREWGAKFVTAVPTLTVF